MAKQEKLNIHLDEEAQKRLLQHKSIRDLIAEAKELTDEQDQKEIIRKLRDEVAEKANVCGAFVKKAGYICTNEPYVREDGTINGRCHLHGGKSSGPKWKREQTDRFEELHPYAQKVYKVSIDRFEFTLEEEEFYIFMMNKYIEDYNLDPVNIVLLDRALRNYFMNARLETAEAEEVLQESRAYTDFDSKSLRYFQALGFDRKFRQSITNSDNKPEGTDIAALFLAPKKEDKKEAIQSEMGDDLK